MPFACGSASVNAEKTAIRHIYAAEDLQGSCDIAKNILLFTVDFLGICFFFCIFAIT